MVAFTVPHTIMLLGYLSSVTKCTGAFVCHTHVSQWKKSDEMFQLDPTKNAGCRRSGALGDGCIEEGEPENLSLSASDLKRLSDLRDRYKVIPILILDAMLPGQRLDFGR